MRDGRKALGLWIAITASMVLFALASGMGWIVLNPKPLVWASYLVGGVLFGTGIVLAGGCVSGSLYKSGQGNLNSMAALIAIPLGIGAVEHGPLKSLLQWLRSFVVTADEGGRVTLSTVTGLPYWVLALLFAGATLGVLIWTSRRKPQPLEGSGDRNAPTPAPMHRPLMQRILSGRWRPWQAGLAIAGLALLAYMSSAASGRNYPLGVSHGVLHAQLAITDPVTVVHNPPASVPRTRATTEPATTVANPPAKKASLWLMLEVAALILGSHTSARLSGTFQLRPKPPDESLIAFGGGLLVGAGAALAGGCVIGNILSGVALMGVGNLLFLVVVVATNWLVTWMYLMGGQRRQA